MAATRWIPWEKLDMVQCPGLESEADTRRRT